jgi:hypothetical protein
MRFKGNMLSCLEGSLGHWPRGVSTPVDACHLGIKSYFGSLSKIVTYSETLPLFPPRHLFGWIEGPHRRKVLMYREGRFLFSCDENIDSSEKHNKYVWNIHVQHTNTPLHSCLNGIFGDSLCFYACENSMILTGNTSCSMHLMSWSSLVYLIALFLCLQFWLLILVTALRS